MSAPEHRNTATANPSLSGIWHPAPLCVAEELLCPVVVVAAAAYPVARFELHGRAMGIVAGVTEVEVVVTTGLAEPVTIMPLKQRWHILPTATTLHHRPRMQTFTSRALPNLVVSQWRRR